MDNQTVKLTLNKPTNKENIIPNFEIGKRQKYYQRRGRSGSQKPWNNQYYSSEKGKLKRGIIAQKVSLKLRVWKYRLGTSYDFPLERV